ncbi:glycosyltransferase family 2 protein [Alcaligenes sp. SMD-FA]|uniref:glycosyltransferase family 2 protein n=1 Tax=Alcaligenes sp. SMD-FA TaxID=2991054 RepID=UPI002227C97E|nr:glycosyltransferase family A protein [Alcaligenes sp. SMD-FA]UYY87990.1 glycosyltransferase family 2 protein [Alcaligenes sp. SMD-FA]
MEWRHLFTVLTPSYNRAHTLERVYRSLCEQTCQDFEWIVVDDGSTDGTRELVEGWQQQAPFPIRYVWQENRHKKAAFNHGVALAQGELIVALDSDDTLLVNALYDMAQIWADIPVSERTGYAGITGLCVRPDGKVVGDMFPQDVFDASSLDMSFRYHVRGEKFGCLSTAVLRKFPFPDQIEGFVPESLVWRAIARAGYKNRFVNTVFRVYHDSPDSLSVQGKTSQQHALGLWLLAQDTVVKCLPWFRYEPKAFLMAAARYTRFGLHLRASGRKPPPGYGLKGLASYLLVALMWPAGVALYLRDKRRA